MVGRVLVAVGNFVLRLVVCPHEHRYRKVIKGRLHLVCERCDHSVQAMTSGVPLSGARCGERQAKAASVLQVESARPERERLRRVS